jgi:hypothetical protein
MTTSEHAFTFSPGRSFLHRWSQRDGRHPTLRLVSKALSFLIVEAILSRMYERVSFSAAVLLDAGVVFGALGLLQISTGSAKVVAVLNELVSVVKLTLVIGLPVFTIAMALASLISGEAAYSWQDVPRVFSLLAGTLATLLSVASLFMATTSLADTIFAIPGDGMLRTFVSLTLISFARAEPELVTRLIALKAMEPPSGGTEAMKLLRRARQYPGRIFLLLTSVVWQLIAVSSIPIYLTLCEESQYRRSE